MVSDDWRLGRGEGGGDKADGMKQKDAKRGPPSMFAATTSMMSIRAKPSGACSMR
jgi:hypothetical protein